MSPPTALPTIHRYSPTVRLSPSPLYTIRGTDFSFNAYNSRGDVVSTSDLSGAATWQAAYEAFGTRTAENGTNAERQRANTKDEDPTGLLNEGFRYRDLEAGVFISRDPAGFVDGPNVYAYVRQNPWSFFDPLGLNREDADGFKWDSENHHKVSVEVARKEFDFTSKEAKNVFNKFVEPTPNGHNMTLHGKVTGYTAQVTDEARAFLKEKGLKKSDIGKMLPDQQVDLAKEFTARITSTKNEFIRYFNTNVHGGPAQLRAGYAQFSRRHPEYVKKGGRIAGAGRKAKGIVRGLAGGMEILSLVAGEASASSARRELFEVYKEAYGFSEQDALLHVSYAVQMEQHLSNKALRADFNATELSERDAEWLGRFLDEPYDHLKALEFERVSGYNYN